MNSANLVNLVKQGKSGVILFLLLGFYNCSSQREKAVTDIDHSSTIKKDYEVRDASSPIRPGWIVDAGTWAGKNNEDTKKFRYFSFETTPKVDREVACSLAKSQARTDIAAEIATFIEQSLGQSREGAASIDENNPNTQSLREFVEVTLAEKIQGLIHGAMVINSYWEKRQYLQSLGAKKDYTGFTCASLIKMDQDILKKAVEQAAQKVVERTDDVDTRDNVKKALKDVAENFIKAKSGLI